MYINTKYLTTCTYAKKKKDVQCLEEVILYDDILLHCQPLCLMLVLSGDQLLGCMGFASTQDYPEIQKEHQGWGKTYINTTHIVRIFTHYCAFYTNSSQWMVAFLAAVNHLSEPLRKWKLPLMGSKGRICGLWLVDFDPCCIFLFSSFTIWLTAL